MSEIVPRSPRERRPSRYTRPRRPISLSVLLIGIVAGMIIGLFVAWNVSPTEEFDTAPWQLTSQNRADYMVALMLAYAYDGDLPRTINGLTELRLPGDPIQVVAETACQLASTGYANSGSGESAIRAMMQFYQLQGRQGCADQLLPAIVAPATSAVIIAPTPTLPPPPTKTATPEGQVLPTDTPAARIVPTTAPQSAFRLARLENLCDVQISGVIEVYVQNSDGTAIPGQRVRVSWNDGSSIFVTGAKPERGLDYADFTMDAGMGYTIELPGLSDPSTQPLVAAPCTTAAGRPSVTSYRAVFRPSL